MLSFFYRGTYALQYSEDMELLEQKAPDEIVWLDIFHGTETEKQLVERLFNIELFTRQEAEEIESSSRYFENELEINANLNYIFHRTGDNGYGVDPVSFILKSGLLITQRNIPLRSFEEGKRILRSYRKANYYGYNVMLLLFETRIDVEADFLEAVSKQIYAVGKDLALAHRIDESVLIEIYNFQELTVLFRETTSELKRLFSSILRSEFFPKDEVEKIRILIKDADSLLSHTNFNFERLEYLQNTFLGLIDMEQNKIIKIFSVMAVVFMPPTMIASLYGMNFQLMPELNWEYGYPFAIALMAASSLVTLMYFKWKKWL